MLEIHLIIFKFTRFLGNYLNLLWNETTGGQTREGEVLEPRTGSSPTGTRVTEIIVD